MANLQHVPPDDPKRDSIDQDGFAPMDAIAFQRTAIGWILGALALVVAAAFIEVLRPLFGGSGFGLAVAIVSCAAGVVLATAVVITNVRFIRHRQRRFRRSSMVAIAAAVTAAVVLDLIACLAAMTNG